MIVSLIGMPGCGKSFWGQLLAQELGWQFVDLDKAIEKFEHKTIPTLFDEKGESYFRSVETAVLKNILDTPATQNLILSCGGGTPCYGQNIKLLLTASKVIYLEAEINYLIRQLQQDANPRPKLKKVPNMAEYLTELLNKRSRFYAQNHAKVRVKTSDPLYLLTKTVELFTNPR